MNTVFVVIAQKSYKIGAVATPSKTSCTLYSMYCVFCVLCVLYTLYSVLCVLCTLYSMYSGDEGTCPAIVLTLCSAYNEILNLELTSALRVIGSVAVLWLELWLQFQSHQCV